MDTIINNSRAPAKVKGNRYYQTIIPTAANEQILLAHMGCVGDTAVSKIQLEKGFEPTIFTLPEVTANQMSGIFSALQGLRVQMADKESSLWSEIIANNKAMLVAYHNDTISGSIGISADAIRQEIKDTLDGRTTSLTQNLNGFQQRVQDAISKSTVTQLSNLYDRKFETVNGNVSQLSQNVDGLRTRVATAEGKASEATQTISGFRQTVNGLNDTYSSWTQTVNGFRQDLRGVNGNYSSLSQLVTGLQSTVRDNERDIESKVTQLSGLIENKVSSSDFVSTIRQNADSIALALNGKVAGKMSGSEIISAINVTTGGVGIYSGSNKLVVTPETTYIQSGTIKSAMIEELDGGKITAGTIKGKHIASDAITSTHLKVDQGLFDKLMANEAYLKQLFARQAFITQVQAVDLTATQIKSGVLRATNGAMSVNLDQSNITFNDTAFINFNSATNVLVRRKGTHTAFLHFADVPAAKDDGAGSVYASFGVTSSGDGVNSASSGRFSGIRVYRAAKGREHLATIDQSEFYGDIILLKDDFFKDRGFQFNPSTIDKMVDMNYLVNAVRALGRCWTHFNNTGWNTSDQNLRNVVMHEFNSYIKNL